MAARFAERHFERWHCGVLVVRLVMDEASGTTKRWLVGVREGAMKSASNACLPNSLVGCLTLRSSRVTKTLTPKWNLDCIITSSEWSVGAHSKSSNE